MDTANEIGRFIVVRRNGLEARSKLTWPVGTKEMIIGRQEDCDIRVLMQTVSRQQAILRYHSRPSDSNGKCQLGYVTIMDKGNINHTKLNNVELKKDVPQLLPHNSIITVGERSLKFEYACAFTPFFEENNSIPPLQPLSNNKVPLPSNIVDNEKCASLPKNDGNREEPMDLSKLMNKIQVGPNSFAKHRQLSDSTTWRDRSNLRSNSVNVTSGLMEKNTNSKCDNEKMNTNALTSTASFADDRENPINENAFVCNLNSGEIPKALSTFGSKTNKSTPITMGKIVSTGIKNQMDTNISSLEDSTCPSPQNNFPEHHSIPGESKKSLLVKLREERMNKGHLKESREVLDYSKKNVDSKACMTETPNVSPTATKLWEFRERKIATSTKSKLQELRERRTNMIRKKISSLTKDSVRVNGKNITGNLDKLAQNNSETYSLKPINESSSSELLSKLECRRKVINCSVSSQDLMSNSEHKNQRKNSLLHALRERRKEKTNKPTSSKHVRSISSLSSQDIKKSTNPTSLPSVETKLANSIDVLRKAFVSPKNENSQLLEHMKFDSLISPQNHQSSETEDVNIATNIGDKNHEYLNGLLDDEETYTILITPTKLLHKSR